jgi:hypothetical protein
LPAITAILCGEPGTVPGVTPLDATDAGPMPALLLAVTVNVNITPFVNPVIVSGLAMPEAVIPPGAAVTV